MDTFRFTAGDGTVLNFTTPIYLNSQDGEGMPPIDIQSQKAPFQDGDTLIDQLFEPRRLTLNFTVTEITRALYLTARRSIVQAMNPKLGTGTFRWVRDDGLTLDLNAVPEDLAFLRGGIDWCQGRAILKANNPFWHHPTGSAATLHALTGGLEFDIEFDIEFATVSGVTSVTNDGDVKCPFTATINGPCSNPKITSNTLGKFLKIELDLDAGESLSIDTEFGQKAITLISGGSTSNAMHYLSSDSEFFDLEPGVNSIEYTEESFGSNAGSCVLGWIIRYLGG